VKVTQTVDCNLQREVLPHDADELEHKEDEQPVVVVLKPGDLTAEEVANIKKEGKMVLISVNSLDIPNSFPKVLQVTIYYPLRTLKIMQVTTAIVQQHLNKSAVYDENCSVFCLGPVIIRRLSVSCI